MSSPDPGINPVDALLEAGKRPPLVVILGPTAVGKTSLSIELASRLKGEIISADSRLLYRSMDIGTDKPSTEERVSVPHHLIDVANPDQVWSLALYQRAAYRAIRDITARGRLPFLVGGTGQYIRAVVEGWQIPEVKPDPRLRRALNRWARVIGKEALFERLRSLDPAAAQKIDYRNLRRTVRALEVIFTSGRRFSAQRQTGPSPFDVLQLGLTRPRTELYERIDRRIEAMISGGLIAEVESLLTRGYRPDLPTMSAIGYREVSAYLAGELSLDAAVAGIKRRTRAFVRRQANWFKPDDPDILWFQAGPESITAMETVIREWLRRITPEN